MMGKNEMDPSAAQERLSLYTISDHASVGEVAGHINRTKQPFVIVVDAGGRLVGTVTDGDLRRAYLANLGLHRPVASVMCSSPVTLPTGRPDNEAVALLRRHRIQHLPIVDAERRPVDVFCLDEATRASRRFRTVVIMAGGEGKRLLPLTETVPKPMVLLHGRPILEHIIEGLVGDGIERVYLSVNYKSEVIERHFEDGSRFGVAISYLRETHKLGTAGSLSLIPEELNEPFVVVNGDVVTNVSYRSLFAFHVTHRGVMTVAAAQYRVIVPYGTLELANQFLLGLSEKPEILFHCNAGVYVLEPEVLHFIPAGQSYDMTTLITTVIHNGFPISVFPIHEYWMDVGRPEDLEKASGNRED